MRIFSVGNVTSPIKEVAPAAKPVTSIVKLVAQVVPVPAPKTGGYWLIDENASNYEAYKNDILRWYQDEMSSCGLPRAEQKVFVQQAIQENGALDPSLTGGTDRGYSFGIGQWYKYPTLAKTWLAAHPEQATLEWQVPELAHDACDRYESYGKSLWHAVVAHNCPRCASAPVAGDKARAATYWSDVTKHAEIVWK